MKMNLKKIVLVGIVLTGIVSGTAQASGDAFDPLRLNVGPSNLVEYVVEDNVSNTAFLGLWGGQVTSSTQKNTWQYCTGLTDPICDPKNSPSGMIANSYLPPCATATSDDCIDSLEIGNGGEMVKARLIRVAGGITFPPSLEYNYLGSSNVSLWDVPGMPSASGLTTYALSPIVRSYFKNGAFGIGEFSAGVTPYKEVTGPYVQQRIDPNLKGTPTAPYTYSQYQQVCVYEEDGLCGVAQDFAAGTRIRLKLRLSKEVGGWFRGRLKDPVLNVSDFSKRDASVTVEGTPVSVPRMALVIPKATLNDQEKIWYQNLGYWPTLDDGNGTGPQAGLPNDAFPVIDYYRAKVNDTASGVNTYWNFSTTSWGSGSQCLQDKSKLLGIVTTNAMAYDGDAPSFENGSLNYHVSGLHYMPGGTTPVQGTYNLVMRSDVARCLYGFTNAPIKATISVAGTGDSIVATTVSGESNGWLSLAASGFTFSNKTIQVKLSQEAPAPAPSATATATPVASESPAPAPVATKAPAVAKKITITCVKGKSTKSVTAVKPTCPAGYKRK